MSAAVLEFCVGERQPEALVRLNPPASEEEIAALEQVLGVALPAGLAESLRIHNGEHEDADGIFPQGVLLSTGGIAEQWRIWKQMLDAGEFQDCESEPDSDGIKPDWWNARWIPFTHNGCGDHLCVDIDPAPGGEPGQVIAMWHDEAEREYCASTYSAWFDESVRSLR